MTEQEAMDELKKKVRVDLENGEVHWDDGRSRAKYGYKVGYIDNNGYKDINVHHKGIRKHVRLHRFLFYVQYGYLPKLVDHKDRNPLNNKISNLRPISPSGNSINSKMSKRNTTGVKGVYWNKRSKMWQALISINGKLTGIGYFKDKNDAIKARKDAEREHYGIYTPVFET